MVDYFSTENAPAGGNAPVNGTTQQANGEDLGMADISVSFLHEFEACSRLTVV